jgi:predicted ATPase
MRLAVRGELGQSQRPVRLAESYGKAGQADEGLRVLAEASAAISKTDERRFEAEVYRLRGELLLQRALEQDTRQAAPLETSPSTEAERTGVTDASHLHIEAETCFRQAIEVARSQQAKSFELRAVMSLTRLWQQQGKRKEAYDMLERIYSWFTEGFETRDLQEARALIEVLQ